MARSYGSSSSKCFSAYRGWTGWDLAIYACGVVFLAVYFGILITLCVVRRRTGAGKQLVGLPYIFALSFRFIEQVLSFLASTLQACQVTRNIVTYYDFNIAQNVFYAINTFLLLFVVIYTLNTMLRKQLGHNPSALKIAFGLDLFILGGLLISFVVLRCYLYWFSARLSRTNFSLPDINWMAPVYISLAFEAAVLLSILASGALSVLTASSLKKKHGARGSFVAWISILILSVIGYSLIDVILLASQLTYTNTLGSTSFAVMYWFGSLFQALAFIAIIFIAKNPSWRSHTFGANTYGVGQHA